MKKKDLNKLVLEAYTEVLTELEQKLTEAPEGIYYIKTTIRDARYALAHLDDKYKGQFDVNDPNIFYFEDEGIANDILEEFGFLGITVIDHNLDEYESLNESLLDEVEDEEPQPEEEGEEEGAVLEDATDTILGKFPTLKAAITKLQTDDFKEFVDSIDWISPRPTSFRINLKNGQDYTLKWTGKTFEAQIMGKRYLLSKIDEYQQALDKLAILYKEAPLKGAGEEPADGADIGSADTGGGDFPGGEGGADTGGADDLGDAPEPEPADLSDEPVDFEAGEEPEA
jgi:hypothetical protein